MASVILGILLVLAPLPLSTEAQTRSNVTLGSSLMANDRNSSWLSPSGEFAFGFQKMGQGAHLLAIWFEMIEEKTVVWWANGDNLAPEGSKVQLTANGGLVLTDPRERELWSSGLNGTGLAYAAMLDTGNFILASASHVKLWDSFSRPTDTILPTQRLNLGTEVNARYSKMNYSAGRFHFNLGDDGNLVFYAKPDPLDSTDAYWASDTVDSGFQLIFNQSGQVYLTTRNGTILNRFTTEPVPTSGYYQRAILEYDGVFIQYIHPKTANSSSGRPFRWSRVSVPVPPNICTSIAQEFGSGACGFNSYCTLGDDLRPRCQCPPGYTPLDSTNEMNGCIPDFVPQSCNGSKPETDQFVMREMLATNWPNSVYEYSRGQTEDWCREACLADCFCAAAILSIGYCWKKKNPLSNGRMGPWETGKTLIKVRISNSMTSTINLGFSLTADDRNSSWLSPSGEFAFGFQKMGRGAHLLAIWFEKIKDKTIIWSANGDNLAPEGSKIELTTDGRLVLADPNGTKLWSPSLNAGVAFATMLDTGNFVLVSQDLVNSWETFSQPTDTILPTQQLDQGTKVNARYSQMNYSTGRFHFKLGYDGNLAFYASPDPWDASDTYWVSNTIGSGFRLIFNQSGQVYLTATNGTVLKSLTSSTFVTSGFYQRAILEYDGVFRQYVYPKTANSSSAWSMVSSPIPPNICTNIMQNIGSGACGFNSYCVLRDDHIDHRPQCLCPLGYTPLDSANEMSGCRQDFVPQSCDRSRPETDQFTFREMLNINWPLSDYERSTAQTEDSCREACLVDCFCAVAIFGGRTCWKKKIPLSNGRMDQSDTSQDGKALIKVRKYNSTSKSMGNGNKNSTLIIIGSVLLSSSVFVNLLLLLITYLIYKIFRSRDSKLSRPVQIKQVTGTRTFTYQELQEATYGFKEEVGRGAFGIVYKGVLGSEDKNFVAVKVFGTRTGESEKEFEREVSAIGQTNHKNLVQLLGFCNEGLRQLLVYEFMSNGTLAEFLFSSSRPSWYKRIEIACSVARGLTYLHDDCTRHIIHCDIKPQNILLDGSLTAKISDFGLAKLLMANQTQTTTGVRGTRGYLAPEWFRNMPISNKVDVYSFGILLVELICCRKNYEPKAEIEAQIVMVDWVYDCYHDGSVLQLVESDEEASRDIKMVKRFVMTALWCIQEDPALRPTMKKTTQMLEGAVEVPVPPVLSSFITSI